MSDHAKKNRAAHEAAYRKRMEQKAIKESRDAEIALAEEAALAAKDERFMKAALAQARKAAALQEVPIGCVIVKDDVIIARGYNRRNTDHSVLSHAEITAIKKAAKRLNDWRLTDCTLYVTLEPCPMCAGAIVQARIPRVVYGAASDKSGCGGSLLDILQNPSFTHRAQVKDGVLAMESAALLSSFFSTVRK